MQIVVIDKLAAIEKLKPQWDQLVNRTQANLFSQHTWVYENYRHFKTKNILLIAVYDNGKQLLGIFPFAIKPFRIKYFKFKALTHGGSAVTDYSQFIIDPAANSRLMIKRVLAKLIELQPDRWDIFKIDNLNDSDDVASLFKNTLLSELYAGVTASEITPRIKFHHAFQQAKKIADLNRRFKKIIEDSTIVHARGNDIDDKLLEEFSSLHQQSYPDAAFDKKHTQAFYKALRDDSDLGQQICLSYIRYEEQIIAAHYGFIDTKTFYYYVPAYDKNYSSYGPGQYLLWQLICLAEKNQLIEFDFLRGDEGYKFDWCNKINTNYTVLGVTHNAGAFRKLLVNLWLLTREIPFFRAT